MSKPDLYTITFEDHGGTCSHGTTYPPATTTYRLTVDEDVIVDDGTGPRVVTDPELRRSLTALLGVARAAISATCKACSDKAGAADN